MRPRAEDIRARAGQAYGGRSWRLRRASLDGEFRNELSDLGPTRAGRGGAMDAWMRCKDDYPAISGRVQEPGRTHRSLRRPPGIGARRFSTEACRLESSPVERSAESCCPIATVVLAMTAGKDRGTYDSIYFDHEARTLPRSPSRSAAALQSKLRRHVDRHLACLEIKRKAEPGTTSHAWQAREAMGLCERELEFSRRTCQPRGLQTGAVNQFIQRLTLWRMKRWSVSPG